MIGVVIKVLGKQLLHALTNEKGVNQIRETRSGNLIVYPTLLRNGIYDHYTLPDCLKGQSGVTILMHATECGGASRNQGYASVVCGETGKELKPYLVPTKGSLSNSDHAYFAVPGTVIEVFAVCNVGVQIRRHTLVVCPDGYITVTTRLLWEGSDESLPDELYEFIDAVEAAASKAGEFHCRDVYYADLRR